MVYPVKTKDGSYTLFHKEFNDHYHSIHGALQESLHIYIQSGLAGILHGSDKKELKILEVGLGTGLNAYLTCIEAEKRQNNIFYTAYEKFPLQQEIIQEIHSKYDAKCPFEQLHQQIYEKPYNVGAFFSLTKIPKDIHTINKEQEYDLIYYDAFSPNAQPEMWTTEILKKMYQSLKIGGSLITYCSKGYVKRNMKEVGFTIQSLPGPAGKREITKAVRER